MCQKRRLVTLTKEARESTTALKEKSELAERILSQAERARKLETDKEKVMALEPGVGGEEDQAAGERSLDVDGPEDGGGLAEKGSSTVPVLEKMREDALAEGMDKDEWTMLDRFYKKYNKVLLDKLALEREQTALMNENAQLQSVLKQVSAPSACAQVPPCAMLLTDWFVSCFAAGAKEESLWGPTGPSRRPADCFLIL